MDVFLSPAQKPGGLAGYARGETPSTFKNDQYRERQLYQDADNDDRDRGLRRIPSAVLLSSSTSRQAIGNNTDRKPSPSAAESQHQASRESTDSLPPLNDAPNPSQPFQAIPASSAWDVCSSPLADLTTLTTAQQDQEEEGPSISHIISPGLSSGIQRKTSQSSFLSFMAEEPENIEPIWMKAAPSTSRLTNMPIRTSPHRQKALARPLGIYRTPPQVVATASQSTLKSTKVSMTPVISGVYEASEADDTSHGSENDIAEEGVGSPSPSPTKRAPLEQDQVRPLSGSSTRNEMLAEFINLSPEKSNLAVPQPDLADKSSITEVASSQSPPDEILSEVEPIYQRRSAPTQSGKTNEADLTPPIQIPSSQTPPAPDPDAPFPFPAGQGMSFALPQIQPAPVAGPVGPPTPERSPSVSYVERWSPGYQQALVNPCPPAAEPAFELPPAQPLTKQNLRRNEHVFRRIAAKSSYSPSQPSLPDFDLPLSQLNEKKRKYSFGLSGNNGGKRAFATPSPSPSVVHAQQSASSPWADWQSIGKKGSTSKRYKRDQRSGSIGPSRSVASVASTFSPSPRTRDRRRGRKGKENPKKRPSMLQKSRPASDFEADVSVESLLAILPKRRTKPAIQPRKPAKRKRRDADLDDDEESSDEEEEEISFEREDWDDSQSSSDASRATEYDEDLFLSKTAKKKQKAGIVPSKNKAAEPQPRKAKKSARPAARSSIRFESVALSQNETYQASKERRLAEYAELDEFRLETEYGYFLPRRPKERKRKSSRKGNR